MRGGPRKAVRAFDHAVTRAMEAAHTPRRTAFLLAVTRLGSLRFLLPATLAAAAVLLVLGRGGSAALLGLAMLGAWRASPFVKGLFRRARPNLWTPLATDPSHSFPSQHTLLATVFFGGVAVVAVPLLAGTWTRLVLLVVLALAVLAVGFSRVYLGAHWTTDVMGGVLLGLLWLTVLAFAADSLFALGHSRSGSEVPPAVKRQTMVSSNKGVFFSVS